MASFEAQLAKLHVLLKGKGRSQTVEVKKLRLKVAMKYMILLATKLLFWCTCWMEEIWKAVVNVDLGDMRRKHSLGWTQLEISDVETSGLETLSIKKG